MEDLRFVVLKDQPKGLGELKHDTVSGPKLGQVGVPCLGLHNNRTVVDVGHESCLWRVKRSLPEDRGKVESRQDGGQGRALPHLHTGLKLQGSTVSMGSSGCTTPVQPPAPAPPVITPPTPAGPAAPPSAPSSMDVDMLELLGYKSDSIDHVSLGGHADSLNEDFKATTTSLDAIADLLNWTTTNQHTITPSSADELCSHLMPLIDTARDLGLLERYLSRDSEAGIHHSSVASSLS